MKFAKDIYIYIYDHKARYETLLYPFHQSGNQGSEIKGSLDKKLGLWQKTEKKICLLNPKFCPYPVKNTITGRSELGL